MEQWALRSDTTALVITGPTGREVRTQGNVAVGGTKFVSGLAVAAAQWLLAGLLVFGGASSANAALIDFEDAPGIVDISVPVPEPSAALCFAVGSLVVGAACRRRR
jgi:hypothetical protein